MSKCIGKKVWIFVVSGFFYHIDKDNIYTIKSEVMREGYNGNQYHWGYVVVDENGKEQEVERGYVVFLPDTNKDEVSMVSSYLSDNEVYAEVQKDRDEVIVSISWGDWKHEHGWCEDLMSYIGYTQIDVEETEENGSDCYSADHYFAKSCE